MTSAKMRFDQPSHERLGNLYFTAVSAFLDKSPVRELAVELMKAGKYDLALRHIMQPTHDIQIGESLTLHWEFVKQLTADEQIRMTVSLIDATNGSMSEVIEQIKKTWRELGLVDENYIA